MEEFRHVKIRDEGNLFSTDGFDENTLSSLSQARAKLPMHRRSRDFLSWIKTQIHTQKSKQKEYWNVYISEKVKAQLPNEDIEEFLTVVEQLHPNLQQNVGGIQEIVDLQQLVESVSMGKTIAVSDA